MVSQFVKKIFLLLSAFALTSNVLVAHFEANGDDNMAAIFGLPLLASVTVLSVLMILGHRKLWIPSLITASFLFFLVWFQNRHDVFNTSFEFSQPFLVHGIGGFLIGVAISDCKTFVKYLSVFSFIYLLLLIPEPITHSFLKGESMTTGYVLSSLIVLLIMSYFTISKDNKIYLILAIIMSLLVVVFTSRGCGLTIVLAWFFFYLRDRYQKGYRIDKTITALIICIIFAIIIFPFIAERVMSSNIDVSDGALVYKYMGGDAGDSNGRNDIWELGLLSIMKYWQTGMGFGADRVISNDSFIHNIFLELFIDFGIPLSILVLYLYWRPVVRLLKTNSLSIAAALVAAMIIRTWGQLLFSSSYLMNMLNIMFIMGISTRIVIDSRDPARVRNTK